MLFRGAIEAASQLTRGQNSEHFEQLPLAALLLMPLAGALLLGLLFNRLSPQSRRLGVVHVMERLCRHQGRMPWRAALYQFAGGVAGLTAGLSGGREGPAVHLGAAASSLLGEALRLPRNSIRALVACGSSAAIAASFNTPMAGVVFAMEVVMMEYTIASFIPVILAAVTATVVCRGVYGNAIAFAVPETDLRSLLEMPYILLAGLVVGVVGGVFIGLVKRFAEFQAWPFWSRATLAGAITGLAAWVAPEALGIGYDTVDAALLGQLAWGALLLVLLAKTLASAACVGVGLPVGVIGPTLVMGALLGGLIGKLGNVLAPDAASEPALYVMLGMAAMMAAVLQAPLAALVAVLELTANPSVILPAMLIIVAATLTVSQLFKQRSVFLASLSALGMQYPPDPSSQHLLRAGVASRMTRNMARLPRTLAVERAAAHRDAGWIVVVDATASRSPRDCAGAQSPPSSGIVDATAERSPRDCAGAQSPPSSGIVDATAERSSPPGPVDAPASRSPRDRAGAQSPPSPSIVHTTGTRSPSSPGTADATAQSPPPGPVDAPASQSPPPPPSTGAATARPPPAGSQDRVRLADDNRSGLSVLSGADLAAHLDGLDEGVPRTAIDLMEIPGLRKDASTIDSRATLLEALEELNRTGGEALCVRQAGTPARIVGVLTRADIEQYAKGVPWSEKHPRD